MIIALSNFESTKEIKMRAFCFKYSDGYCEITCNTNDPGTNFIVKLNKEEIDKIGFVESIMEASNV